MQGRLHLITSAGPEADGQRLLGVAPIGCTKALIRCLSTACSVLPAPLISHQRWLVVTLEPHSPAQRAGPRAPAMLLLAMAANRLQASIYLASTVVHHPDEQLYVQVPLTIVRHGEKLVLTISSLRNPLFSRLHKRSGRVGDTGR